MNMREECRCRAGRYSVLNTVRPRSAGELERPCDASANFVPHGVTMCALICFLKRLRTSSSVVCAVFLPCFSKADDVVVWEGHHAPHARVTLLDARHAILAARWVEEIEHRDVIDVLTVKVQLQAVGAVEGGLGGVACGGRVSEAIDQLKSVWHSRSGCRCGQRCRGHG